MKRKILLASLFIVVLCAKGFTQTAKPLSPVKTGNEWKMPSDVFQRAKTYSSNLQNKLGLDPIQTTKVYNLYVANTKPLDEIAVAAVSDKEKASMRKSNELAFNVKMKEILSASQFQQYLRLLPVKQ